jgi:hypothetical protein
MQIDFNLINVEPDDLRAFRDAHPLNIEEHDEAALRLPEARDRLLELRG